MASTATAEAAAPAPPAPGAAATPPTATAVATGGPAPAVAVSPSSVPPTQLAADAAAAQVSAAVGVVPIATPVSMSLLSLVVRAPPHGRGRPQVLDHNRVRAMYDAYRSPAVRFEHKQLLARKALSSHTAKEEMVLYPVVRSALGAAEADGMLSEHVAVKTLLAALDVMVATEPNFDIQLRSSLDAMLRHMQEEEAHLLPRLAALLSAESQLELGIRFEASTVRAPTRPHPEAANLPPFNETAFAAAKQVDVALDQARMPSMVPPTVTLSALAAAAMGAAASAAAAPAGPPPPPATSGFDVKTVEGGGAGGGTDTGGGGAGPAPLPAATGFDTHSHAEGLGMGAGVGAEGGAAAARGDTEMGDVGAAGAAAGGDVDDNGALGAAGGMPGDLTLGAGGGGGAALGEPDTTPSTKSRGPQEMTPAREPDEPLRVLGEGAA